MARFIVDVRGALIIAEFDPGHRMYVSVPKGFEKRFPRQCCDVTKTHTSRHLSSSDPVLEEIVPCNGVDRCKKEQS
jgi:hypothetical protein